MKTSTIIYTTLGAAAVGTAAYLLHRKYANQSNGLPLRNANQTQPEPVVPPTFLTKLSTTVKTIVANMPAVKVASQPVSTSIPINKSINTDTNRGTYENVAGLGMLLL